MRSAGFGVMTQEQEFDLKKYLYIIYVKRWILISVMAIVMFLDVVFTFKQIPIYRATSLVLIEKPQMSLSAGNTREAIMPAIGWQDYYFTQYEILKSKALLKKVVKALDLGSLKDFKEGFPENALGDIVIIEPIKNARLVKINVDYKDPQMAARIANTLVGLYIEQNIESMLFMSKEILRAFPKDAREIESHTIYGQLKELSKEESMDSLPSIVQNQTLQKLRSDRIGIESELANLSKRYKDKHPKITALNTKLKFINDEMKAETARIMSSLRADLAGRLQANNIRVIDYAEIPGKPVRPEKTKNILIGFLLSVFMGLGLIFLTEYLDDSVKSQEDVEEKLKLPYLGDFPVLKNTPPASKLNEDFNEIDKDPGASDSIRGIKTNIIFSAPKDELKTVLFTSTLPKEGKSLTAGYTAFLLAKSGYKTLLLDADVRKPRAHTLLNMNKTPGLVNILVEGASIEEAIRKTRYDNMFLMPSGSKTPNPLELLSSDRMQTLLNELSLKFDKIIIDTPPCFNISDAVVLSKIVNATVLVTKYGTVSVKVLEKVRDKFLAIGSRVAGMIINFSQMEKSSYYKYKYYHKYYKDYYSSGSDDAPPKNQKAAWPIAQ
ncbi:MAG: polysaccharide biosynthesis tyrosine autokinase [Candidatus Omnitrophota bacterium]|nr:polysaccharide biosynthesis tyrosine autokinase [Candidatus Omnitrophota bacterium]